VIGQKKGFPRKTMLVIYLYIVLLLLLLVTAASYTWFSISRTPRVSDMFLFINSATGLEISTDPLAEEWQLQLDFRDMVNETSPLRPVTWSDRDQRFYAARYGLDGRLENIADWEPLTDERNANKDNYDGYYVKATFYARSDQTETVSLSPAVEVDEGIEGSGTYVIGTPLWDGEQLLHSNGGQGAECAVRFGFRVTPVDATGVEEQGTPRFLIYEPNSDRHIDGTIGYLSTPSIHGEGALISEDRLIRQTASSWTEAYPVERDVVMKDLGEFQSSPELFTLQPGQTVKIDLYVWLEGQDVDCTNQITQAQIVACIQLASESSGQSGMHPIP
jgi:hypothetical protein